MDMVLVSIVLLLSLTRTWFWFPLFYCFLEHGHDFGFHCFIAFWNMIMMLISIVSLLSWTWTWRWFPLFYCFLQLELKNMDPEKHGINMGLKNICGFRELCFIKTMHNVCLKVRELTVVSTSFCRLKINMTKYGWISLEYPWIYLKINVKDTLSYSRC